VAQATKPSQYPSFKATPRRLQTKKRKPSKILPGINQRWKIGIREQKNQTESSPNVHISHVWYTLTNPKKKIAAQWKTIFTIQTAKKKS